MVAARQVELDRWGGCGRLATGDDCLDWSGWWFVGPVETIEGDGSVRACIAYDDDYCE